MIKIVVDEKIPYIREALSAMGVEAFYAPGSAICSDMIHDADALLIRTRTQCDSTLLEGSRVRFIATATIGYDHIDTEYCAKHNIYWTNAPGCNAASVRQYVQSALLSLQQERKLVLTGSVLGVVGVGNVGTLVAKMAASWGMRVLCNDPLREERGEKGFVPLEVIAQEADIVTLHTPLTRSGNYATFHLADKVFFDSLQRKPFFFNTSRGETTDTDALLKALDNGLIADAVIDVWENEPYISRPLLERCYIATPHIAGYSADGKANATQMVLKALTHFFGLGEVPSITPPPPKKNVLHFTTREEALMHIYDVRNDSQRLKNAPDQFEQLRSNYPFRREEQAYKLCIGEE